MNRRQVAMGFAALLAAGCAHGADDRSLAPEAEEEEPMAHATSGETFVFFLAADDAADLGISPHLDAMLAGLSAALSSKLHRPVRHSILADAQTGLLDVRAGRELIDRVNGQYGLTLEYTSGPYLVVLQRDPSQTAVRGDRVLVAAFARQTPDAVTQSIEAIAAATLETDTRRLNLDAIIAQFKESWATHSPVQTHTASASATSSTNRP